MKKIISLLLAFCLAAALAACGREEKITVEGIKETEVEVSAGPVSEQFPAIEPEVSAVPELPKDKNTRDTVYSEPYEEAVSLIENAENEERQLSLNAPELSQTDMNASAYKIFESWDKCLNDIWSILKETLPPEEMKKLTSEEIEWIRYKEAAVEEAGREAEGGTLYPVLIYTKAAELTRERAYLLLEYLR